ncbi:hypothetical protein PoB_004869800 [Plakobranchus ocellatus]|uniref:Uncharacterized protein n=1 Tax=Plakobranchus ocellatus TaxID=259542 RepID=A0AAV4BRI8_9GAST|nr:hypothetical protein PoB_004869800 [Plakobranchus ocellatus]
MPCGTDVLTRKAWKQGVQDQGELPSKRKSAVVWHGEGWVPPCDIAQDTQHEHEDENPTKKHTGSVVARTKDRLFRWQDPPGRRWKLCYWLIQQDHLFEKQDCNRYVECADIERSWDDRTT